MHATPRRPLTKGTGPFVPAQEPGRTAGDQRSSPLCQRAGRARRGFTLVEMIIVIAIMLLLIGLAAGLSPRMQDRKKMNQAIESVQGALLIAKQRAKRDKMPTGIRLQPGTGGNGYYVQELIPIQQPDDYTTGKIQPARGAGGQAAPLGRTVQFSGANFRGNATQQSQYLVQKGDFLEVLGGGHVHLITAVGTNSVTLANPPDATCFLNQPTDQWRIIRGPRALIGEVPVKLNQDVAVDITPGLSYNLPTNPATGNIDIVFSPGGGVLNGGSGQSAIYLWVRDVTLSDPTAGAPAIIAINSRSGFVTTHPVATTGDPYQYAKDGKASGM